MAVPELSLFTDDQLLPISALQHYLFCPRQCALIHLEQAWAENQLTAEGRLLHNKAHDGPNESRPGVRITRGMPVVSRRYGLSGQCDVVEFHADGRVVPVEYKRGRPKRDQCDAVQLCAQALALEEMLGTSIPGGLLYYGEQRRRTETLFDGALRALTMATSRDLHALIASRVTPRNPREPKCDRCSLFDLCLPQATGLQRRAAAWFWAALTDASATSPA
jgi:CRISPR-associated exonuclease Cas4